MACSFRSRGDPRRLPYVQPYPHGRQVIPHSHHLLQFHGGAESHLAYHQAHSNETHYIPIY